MTSALITEWLGLLPVTAVLLLAVYLPGTVFLLLLRTRPTVALAGGPLISASMLGVGGVGMRMIGVGYGWPGFAGLVAVLWLLALLLRALVARGAGRTAATSWRRVLRPRSALLILGAALVSLATLWGPLVAIVDPGMPSPRVDPMYHYNVLNAVLETGNISLNSAVDFNYGLHVGHVTYPTVWHAFAVLGVGLVGIVPAANALTYLVIPVVFVVNAGLFARVAFRRSRIAALAAVLAAGALPAFPGALLMTRAFWPNALAIAMLPGAIVVVIMFLRRSRWSYVRRHPWLYALDSLVVLAVVIGLGLTHPSVLFSFFFIVIPLLLSAAIKVAGIARRTLSRRAHLLVVGALVVVPLGVLTALLVPERVRSYILRPGVQAWDEFTLKGVSLLVNWPTDITNPQGIVVALVYIPLLVGGVVLLGRHRGRRWIAVAWVVNAALAVGSYFPVPVLSGLSGLWYADTYRIYAVQAAVLPMAVAAVAVWAQRRAVSADGPRRRAPLRSLWAWGAIAGALAGTMYINAGAARHVGAEPVGPRPVMGEEEWQLLDRIGSELPDGSVVIGDPASGVAYLSLDSDVETVFTQMNLRDIDEDGIFLSQEFDRIGTDPRVCELLQYYGIEYFYEDETFEYNYDDREDVMPGFYGVDTSRGFTLVDEGGGAQLWRIDACGPIEPPDDWWQRTWRRIALVDLLGEEPSSGNPAQPG